MKSEYELFYEALKAVVKQIPCSRGLTFCVESFVLFIGSCGCSFEVDLHKLHAHVDGQGFAISCLKFWTACCQLCFEVE